MISRAVLFGLTLAVIAALAGFGDTRERTTFSGVARDGRPGRRRDHCNRPRPKCAAHRSLCDGGRQAGSFAPPTQVELGGRQAVRCKATWQE